MNGEWTVAVMQAGASGSKSVFQDRVQRINSGKAYVAENVLATPQRVTSIKNKGKSSRPVIVEPEIVKPPRDPSSGSIVGFPTVMIWSFVIGAMSVVLARLARFHLAGETDALALQQNLIPDVVLAILISIALTRLFRVNGVFFLIMNAAGIAAAAVGMHLVVHRFPHVWTGLFSPNWVTDILLFTDPGSIIF